MNKDEIFGQIKTKKSFLCIGLDTDSEKIPEHLLSHPDPVFEFNRQIIDATHDLCVAYKINTAFYEADGVKGWESMKKTFDHIPQQIFTIADAKRGDIGNTSAMYARAFFGKEKSGFDFDAITVAPYMGEDSVAPFLAGGDRNKWVILLALTSNKGSEDFQLLPVPQARNTAPDIHHTTPDLPGFLRETRSSRPGAPHSQLLYEEVIIKSQQWGTAGNMMYVIGATHPEKFAHCRTLAPDHFFLVPGVGAQGGDLKTVAEHGMNKQCGLLVNVSRQVIYASMEKDFAEAARNEALRLQGEMAQLLEKILH